MPGFGCSSPQPERAIADWPLNIATLLAHEGWLSADAPKINAIGYSFGGPHVLSLLSSASLLSHLSALMLVSPTMPPELADAIPPAEQPKNVIPFRAVALSPTFGRGFIAISLLLMRRRVFREADSAMARLRVHGHESLASWLEASNERALSRTSAGLADNLRLREDTWRFIDQAATALRTSQTRVVVLSDPGDTIDPPSVSRALVTKLLANAENANVQHISMPTPSEHGHWHYWVQFEEELALFLEAVGQRAPLGSLSRTCEPSPLREFGPFYKPAQPHKTSSEICAADAAAAQHGWAVASSTFARRFERGLQTLEVSGVVTAWDGSDCVAVVGAEVDVWQSHQYGPYGHLDVGVSDGFCQGYVRTDDTGRFSFRIVMPGSYGALAGASPLGPTVDLPPFVDRHIHLAVWAAGHELLVTQILYLDDPLLNSGIRSKHHGYEGTGVLMHPQRSNASDTVWSLEEITLTLPRTKRPSRIVASRAEATRAYCTYSVGDFLTPAVCMDHITPFVPPMALYFFILPAMLYVYLPLAALLVLWGFVHCCCRRRRPGAKDKSD